MSSSCTPVTVTVWATFQSDGVKVSVDPVTDTAPVSSEVTVTDTSCSGSVASAKSNVAVDPSVTGTVAGATSPAVSSSSTNTS